MARTEGEGVMSWEYARDGLTCHTCHAPITDGEIVRRGDVATANVWCVGCAKARLDDESPSDIPARVQPMSKLAMPASFAKFSRQATGQRLRENILAFRDGRQLATGERD